MKRVAIVGGGISGLTCAYELELARKRGAPIDWHLYEASDRLGGIIETTRHATPDGEYILEGGPDGWVSEKPWARELAIDLGLESELVYSNDATRRTYILLNGELQRIPDRMRMMVPEDLSALDASPLFSDSAKKAYANELTRAEDLKASAPDHDESVADFVRRHFGDEVLNTLAAPLLGGVFGGDVHKLSVRAVMPQFLAMEREHGSLIAALQARARQRTHAPQPIFTTLRGGMYSLIKALIADLQDERIHLRSKISDLANLKSDCIVLATALDSTRALLEGRRADAARFLPKEASSALLVAFTWSAQMAQSFTIASGFGFLVADGSAGEDQLLACTFVDQKFPQRAPNGARVMRAFFGGESAKDLESQSDEVIAVCALEQLREILGPIPEPAFQTVRRWPRSLPQYEVGHLERIAKLEELVAQVPGLHLLGNSYRGVGIPDLIRDARATARAVIEGV
ncbi:MAG TPA: protoporphyrinogen oxidase [Acidobacteriaceae bacterium]|jgi:oxygen-dependent protoporphyrinogen oxidase